MNSAFGNANGVSTEDDFVALLLNHLPRDAGPVAIQAGHFLLIGDPASTKCVPGVFEELERDGQVGEAYALKVRDRVGIFPSGTWRLGTRLAVRLREGGTDASLTTIVNDWQYVPRARPGEAEERRRLFYGSQPGPLPSYLATIENHGLGADAVARLGPHGAFLSEYWLRRRLERHLKQIKRANGVGSDKLYWDKDEEGNPCLMLDEADGEKCLLECGQSDCAGEVMELVYLAASKGFRTLVNFVPAECEVPVNEGTRRAIMVFHLAGMHVVNVSLSCAGEGSLEEMLARQWCLHLFDGIIHDSGQAVNAEHRPIRRST